MNKIKEYNLKIKEAMFLSQSVKHIVFEAPEKFKFSPGQYIHIKIPDTHPKIRRAYSICSLESEKNLIEICVKKIEGGVGSKYIFNLKKGDYVDVIGPIGAFKISEEAIQRDIVFVATGTGIAPFRSMIPFVLEKSKFKVILFAGYKNEEVILYNEFFKSLKEKFTNFEYKPIVSKPLNQNYGGYEGHVQNLIENYVNLQTEYDFYICGLSDMVTSVYSLLKSKGVCDERIKFEKYN